MQAYGIRQELHERSRGAESLKHQIQEIIAGYFLICQRRADGEVFALDVFDKRVSRVVTGWRPLQRFTCHAAGRAKGPTRGRSAPLFGISGDLGSNFFERLGLGLPNSAADHGVAWCQMKEICRSGPVFALGVPEVRRGVRLVRALVFRKPYVAINTQHRAAIGPRIGDESAADLFERWREVGDQTQERRLDVGLVAILVRLEPPALVVSLEVPEKPEQTWPEITVRCHGLMRHLLRSHLYVRSRYLCKALARSRRLFLPIMPMRGLKSLNTPFGVILSS